VVEVLKKINNNQKYTKYIKNISWLFAEKIIKMFLGLFVGILMARYLEPDQFGIFNYSLAIVSLAGVFVYLGLSGILVHDLVDKPEKNDQILGTAFFMKLTGSLVAYLILVIVALVSSDYNSIKFWLLIIMGISLFLRPFEVIDAFNESKLQVVFSAKPRSYAFILMSILKIILLINGFSLLFVGLTISLEAVIMVLLLLFYYKRKGYLLKRWRFDLHMAKELIGKSWKLIFSFVFVIILLKVDQLMLAWMINDREVGIYSVAATLSEAWGFIPAAIVASVFPALIKKKKDNPIQYQIRLQQLYDFLFALAFIIAICVSFFSEQIIFILYGEAYIQSAAVLSIHVWSGVFIFIRILFSRWIIMENLLIFSLITQSFGAVLNIVLNLMFIKEYGARGAALSTIISYAGASYIVLFFHKSTREQAKMITLSFLLPFRAVLYGKCLWKIQ